MKANFDRFKRLPHLVPKISTLKPYQTRTHLSNYIPKQYIPRFLNTKMIASDIHFDL